MGGGRPPPTWPSRRATGAAASGLVRHGGLIAVAPAGDEMVEETREGGTAGVRPLHGAGHRRQCRGFGAPPPRPRPGGGRGTGGGHTNFMAFLLRLVKTSWDVTWQHLFFVVLRGFQESLSHTLHHSSLWECVN